MQDREAILQVIQRACSDNPSVLDYAFLRETYMAGVFAYFFKTLKDPGARLARYLPLTDIPSAQDAARVEGLHIGFECVPDRDGFINGTFPLLQRQLPLRSHRCVCVCGRGGGKCTAWNRA